MTCVERFKKTKESVSGSRSVKGKKRRGGAGGRGTGDGGRRTEDGGRGMGDGGRWSGGTGVKESDPDPVHGG
jgi:hypothetical protein